jgi:hypothetical protein
MEDGELFARKHFNTSALLQSQSPTGSGLRHHGVRNGGTEPMPGAGLHAGGNLGKHQGGLGIGQHGWADFRGGQGRRPGVRLEEEGNSDRDKNRLATLRDHPPLDMI